MKALTHSSNVPDYMKERHFATWGWFEDNILKSFFELTTGGGTKLQEIRSSTSETIDNIAGGIQYKLIILVYQHNIFIH